MEDGWEVDRDKIDLIHELGQGSFGMVHEGIMHSEDDDELRVAVKVCIPSLLDEYIGNPKRFSSIVYFHTMTVKLENSDFQDFLELWRAYCKIECQCCKGIMNLIFFRL